MRVAFFVLLALNLVYLAWAGWIDAPAVPVGTAQANVALPELALATDESKPADPAQLAKAVTGASSPAAQTVASTSEDEARAAPDLSRCVSVGPFNDLARAARGAALLRERGLNPKQRAEPGETWNGFWVYVGGLKTESEEARVMRELTRAGLTDAASMPTPSGERRVSVGLFSEKERAEKRANSLKKLGLSADIVERRQPGTLYWVDIELGANDRSVSTEGLLANEEAGARLEIRVCPSSGTHATPGPSRPGPMPRDARPAATTADAGVPRPG